ncbi:hypothetical protein C8J38_105145 [Rhizobium sp. PP-WC-2G-219]|nr:hypothetical protein C8J32_105121 [Rhizobium sp. PP-CC-3A-592]PYE41722.1 hypothetical protein DFI02_10957 [Rhizobium sp. PP-F2F-G20b]TCL91842.1 hypothetical protein C8J38_105145 [Rhizobium sp. PP-WC-2G-219]
MTTLPTDLETALAAHARQQNISRDEAVRRILREWMRTHGFLADEEEGETPPSPTPGKPDPEFVQYPGYFKGEGSL